MANPNAISSQDEETPDQKKKREAEIQALEDAYSKPAFETPPTIADSLLDLESGKSDVDKSFSDMLAADLKGEGESLLSPRQEKAAGEIGSIIGSEANADDEDEDEDNSEASEDGEDMEDEEETAENEDNTDSNAAETPQGTETGQEGSDEEDENGSGQGQAAEAGTARDQIETDTEAATEQEDAAAEKDLDDQVEEESDKDNEDQPENDMEEDSVEGQNEDEPLDVEDDPMAEVAENEAGQGPEEEDETGEEGPGETSEDEPDTIPVGGAEAAATNQAEAEAEDEEEEDTEPEAEEETVTDEDKQEKQKETGASTGSPFKVSEGPRKANANTEDDQTDHLKNLDRKQIQKEFIAAADPNQGPTRLAKRFGGKQEAWTAFLAETHLKHRGKDSIQSEEDITRDSLNAKVNDESEGSVRTKDAIRDLESKAHKAEYSQRIAKVQKDLHLEQQTVTEQTAQAKNAEEEDTLAQEEAEDENDSEAEQQSDADAENTTENIENSENDEELDNEAEEQAAAEEDEEDTSETSEEEDPTVLKIERDPQALEDELSEEDTEALETEDTPEEEEEQEKETVIDLRQNAISSAPAFIIGKNEVTPRSENQKRAEMQAEEAALEDHEREREEFWHDKRKSQQQERQRADRYRSQSETLNRSTDEDMLERRKEAVGGPTGIDAVQSSSGASQSESEPAPTGSSDAPLNTQLAKTDLFTKRTYIGQETNVQPTKRNIYKKSLKTGVIIGAATIGIGSVLYVFFL